MDAPKSKAILTVAGLDSSGGAGVTADVLAITSLGLDAAVACTAVTAQTSDSVRRIMPVPVEVVAAQMEAAVAEYDLRAVKTGMLVSADVVHAVAEFILRHFPPPSKRPLLVIDPVMSATAGGRLLDEPGVNAMMRELLPRATVVTPNLLEAERLTGMKVGNVEQMREAARAIRALGPQGVIVTGGHLPDKAVDVVYDGTRFDEFSGPLFPIKVHGTGCTYASSLAAYLALGTPLAKAAAGAKGFTRERIEEAMRRCGR
jgi:hydroxymethylpyrimidine kinase/phosphomethylpyrimidine kinase